MKKILTMLLVILTWQNIAFADETVTENSEILTSEAEQVFEMRENKVIVNVLKQPLNENSKQKIILKKNWFVVNIGINGKVKVNPISATYEVQ